MLNNSNNTQPPLALRPPPPNAATASAVVPAAPPLSSAPSAVRPAPVGPPAKDRLLPPLPSHALSCGVDPPRALRSLDAQHDVLHTAVVDMFGDVSSRDAIRAKLLRFYEETNQVATSETSTSAEELVLGTGISEMTLRIDTELELLRQQCFAERNAQWDYHTPAMFAYEPVRESPAWNPLLVGNTNIALRRLKRDAASERIEKEAAAAVAANNGTSASKKDGKGFPLGQFARDRPWPPREFMQKAATRPSRARGGKRKAPAPVIEERSIFSKLCVECHTQSTPLWRRIARASTSLNGAMVTNSGAIAVRSEKAASASVMYGAPANGAMSIAPSVARTELVEGQQLDPPAAIENAVDVCLECYLKLQRSDIFARKQTERAQQQREKQDRTAAEAIQEKKRLKQQLQLLKKQQQAQAKNSKKRKPTAQHQHEFVVEQQPVAPIEAPATADTTTTAPVAIKIVIKTDVGLEDRQSIDEKERLDHGSRPKSAKRDKKKSKKDKKKKKKKKKQRNSDAEDGDAESDSGTPLPSPPQMVGQYEYADLNGDGGADGGGMRSSRSASSATSFNTAVVEVPSAMYEDELVQVRQPVVDESVYQELFMAAEETVTTSSKRTRKSTSRSEVTTTATTSISSSTTTTVTPSSSSKSSRKRKNSVVLAAPAITPDATPPSSSRPSRSKASAIVAAAPIPAPVVAVVAPPPPISARKRARTKKESARERELRAMGQYCPVCNAVYEEDDESSFVCCDSCEMWVHAACDTTLTPYVSSYCGLFDGWMDGCLQYRTCINSDPLSWFI